MTREVGDLLFVSGLGPRKPKSDTSASSVPGIVMDASGNFETFDFKAQVESVFANVETVLAEAGRDKSKLVDITVFLTDMQRDFRIFNEMYADWVSGLDPKPCRTTVQVTALPTPIAIELKCIATR